MTTVDPTKHIAVSGNITNVYAAEKKKEKEKGGGYHPGSKLYKTIELLVHYGMFNRCNTGLKSEICTPMYKATYGVSFVAGMAFGLYQASTGNTNIGLNDRAKAFSEGGFTQKIVVLAELLLGPAAVMVLEENSGPQILGSAIVGGLAFNLGADAARWAYNQINPKKAE